MCTAVTWLQPWARYRHDKLHILIYHCSVESTALRLVNWHDPQEHCSARLRHLLNLHHVDTAPPVTTARFAIPCFGEKFLVKLMGSCFWSSRAWLQTTELIALVSQGTPSFRRFPWSRVQCSRLHFMKTNAWLTIKLLLILSDRKRHLTLPHQATPPQVSIGIVAGSFVSHFYILASKPLH